MFILLLSYATAMQDFLTYFHGREFSGTSLSGQPCVVYIVDFRDPVETPYFRVQIDTAEYDYQFVYLYEAKNPRQETTKISQRRYFLDNLDSNAPMADIYFSYGPKFVEIERKGVYSQGPRIRCTKN